MVSHINVGCGHDITIQELAETIARVIGYAGDIVFDTSKPDGTSRKLMDNTRINALGWQAQVGLEAGLEKAYEDFLQNYANKQSRRIN
jgi:GDP-L-fucose synthase